MGTEQSHLLDSFMTTTIGFTRMGLSTCTISIEWSRKRSLRNQQGSFNREYDYENRIYNVCHHGHVTLLRQITPCLLWNQQNEKIMH